MRPLPPPGRFCSLCLSRAPRTAGGSLLSHSKQSKQTKTSKLTKPDARESSESSLSPSTSNRTPLCTSAVTDPSAIKFCGLFLRPLLVPKSTAVPTLGHTSSPPPTGSPTLPSKPSSVCVQSDIFKHKSTHVENRSLGLQCLRAPGTPLSTQGHRVAQPRLNPDLTRDQDLNQRAQRLYCPPLLRACCSHVCLPHRLPPRQ